MNAGSCVAVSCSEHRSQAVTAVLTVVCLPENGQSSQLTGRAKQPEWGQGEQHGGETTRLSALEIKKTSFFYILRMILSNIILCMCNLVVLEIGKSVKPMGIDWRSDKYSIISEE